MSNQTSLKARELAIAVVGLVLVVALLLAVLAAGWYAVRRTNPDITIAVLGAGTTIAVSTLTVTLGRVLERKKQIEAEQRAKWADMYERFVRQWMSYMGVDKSRRTTRGDRDSDAAAFMAEFSAQAMTWASDRAIVEWTTWKAMAAAGDADPQALLVQFEKLMLAMRADLGHKDHDLRDHRLLRMFITDWDSTGREKERASQSA